MSDDEIINALIARILVRMCLEEAQLKAQEIGDTDLNNATIAALGKMEIVKTVSKCHTVYSLDTALIYLSSHYVDTFNDYFNEQLKEKGQEDIHFVKLSDIMPTSMNLQYEQTMIESIIMPVFRDLKTFDYSNPSDWYQRWLAEKFPWRYPKDKTEGG